MAVQIKALTMQARHKVQRCGALGTSRRATNLCLCNEWHVKGLPPYILGKGFSLTQHSAILATGFLRASLLA